MQTKSHKEEGRKGGDTVGGKKDHKSAHRREGPTGMKKGKKQTITQGSL